jgi:hypothetical protein
MSFRRALTAGLGSFLCLSCGGTAVDTGDNESGSQEPRDEAPQKQPTNGFSSQELSKLEVGGIACGITIESTLACEDFTYDFGESVEQLAVSDFHGGIQTICALLESGKVRCVGGTDYALDPEERYVFISSSDLNLCGVTARGRIDCVAGSEPEGEFVSIATGSDYSCAIEVTGELLCFNSLGDGAGEEVDGAPAGRFSAVAVNEHQVGPACGILIKDGELVCWTPLEARANSLGHLYPPRGSFVEVAVGFSSACAVDASGQVTCFTRSPTEAETSITSPVNGIFSELSADGGSERYCALDEGKHSICWAL